MLPYNKYLFKFLKQKQMQYCFVNLILKAGLISCWSKKHNAKRYLATNKHSGSDLNLSSHTKLPCKNCCFVGYKYSVSMEKRILECQKCSLQDMWQKIYEA